MQALQHTKLSNLKSQPEKKMSMSQSIQNRSSHSSSVFIVSTSYAYGPLCLPASLIYPCAPAQPALPGLWKAIACVSACALHSREPSLLSDLPRALHWIPTQQLTACPVPDMKSPSLAALLLHALCVISATVVADKREGPIVVVGSVNMDIIVEVQRLMTRHETITAKQPYTSMAVGGKGANQVSRGSKFERSYSHCGKAL